MSHIVKGEVFGFWLGLHSDGRGRGDLQTGGLVYLRFQLWIWGSNPNEYLDALITVGRAREGNLSLTKFSMNLCRVNSNSVLPSHASIITYTDRHISVHLPATVM